MTAFQAAGLWIGLNILLFLYLSARVGQARMRYKVNLGDGGHPQMLKAIRTHANYAEYGPIALLGLLALAALGAATVVIHVLGAAFFLARIAHLIGLGMEVWPHGRSVGAFLTGLTLLSTAGFLIYYALV